MDSCATVISEYLSYAVTKNLLQSRPESIALQARRQRTLGDNHDHVCGAGTRRASTPRRVTWPNAQPQLNFHPDLFHYRDCHYLTQPPLNASLDSTMAPSYLLGLNPAQLQGKNTLLLAFVALAA